MQLHVARLCLDCNEVHDAQHCPKCSSEAFAYLSRWVPAPERRLWNRPNSSPEAEVFRELIEPAPQSANRGRLLKRGALGIGAVALVAGWFWRRNEHGKNSQSESADDSRSTTG